MKKISNMMPPKSMFDYIAKPIPVMPKKKVKAKCVTVPSGDRKIDEAHFYRGSETNILTAKSALRELNCDPGSNHGIWDRCTHSAWLALLDKTPDRKLAESLYNKRPDAKDINRVIKSNTKNQFI